MSVKERIISVRLIEMIHRNPEYAEKIGLKGETINLEFVNKTKTGTEKIFGLTANKRIDMKEEES